MTDKAPSKREKRNSKSPETFRERVTKASNDTVKAAETTHSRRPRTMFTKAISPIKKVIHRLDSVQPFKAVFWFLRKIGRILFPSYLRGSVTELRQVKWPNWEESRRLTYAVLGFALVFGTAVALLDFGLDKVFRTILLK